MDVLTDDRRAALVDELTAVMETAKAKVLVYALFRRVGQAARLRDCAPAKALIAAGISLAVLGLTWIINRLAGRPVSSGEWLTLLIPAAVAGVCLWLIRVVEESMFIKNMKLFTEMPADEETFVYFIQDFRNKFRYAPQAVFAALFAGVGLATARLVCADFTHLAGNAGFYVGIALASACIGMGAYFALILPTIVVTVASRRVTLYPYNPAQSRMAAAGMSIVGQLTLGTGAAAALIMILLFVANPWGTERTFAAALGWLVFVWGLTTYTFALPFAAMTKAIQKEKQFQVERISRMIQRFDGRLAHLTSEELAQMQTLIDLRQQVFQSRDTPAAGSFRNYLTSLVLPTVSFVVGSYDTLRELARAVL